MCGGEKVIDMSTEERICYVIKLCKIRDGSDTCNVSQVIFAI